MSTSPKPNKPGVNCPKCGNRLRLLADQLGTQVMCPKCQGTFTVAWPGSAPVRPADKGNVPYDDGGSPSSGDDDAYEPEIPLVRSSVVPEEQMTDLRPSANVHEGYEVDWGTADVIEAEPHHQPKVDIESQLLESAKARGLIREEYVPDPPRWTFFSGVWSYPWQGVNLGRWTGIACGLSISGVAMYHTLELLGFFGGLSTGALGGVLLGIFTLAITLATLAFTSASWLAIVQDTANGHDEPQDASLPDWDQWVFSFLCLFGIWALSGAIGYPLATVLGPGVVLVSCVVLFPILLLSALEADSFLLPYSALVLKTLVQQPHLWALFYLLTTTMLAVGIVAFDLAAAQAPSLTLLLAGPMWATLLLLYARLLGRLAWRVSGAPMAAIEPLGERGETSQERPGKKSAKKIRIQLPDEIQVPDDTGAEPRPRINFHHRD